MESQATPSLLKPNRDAAPVPPLYWPALDQLRAIAFLLVFMHHAGAIPGVDQPVLFQRFVAFGWLGVDLFFVISGFLMTSLLVNEHHTVGRISIGNFYSRRAVRIWPAYTILLAAILMVMPWLSHYAWTLSSYQSFLGRVGTPLLLFCGNFSILRDCPHTVAACIKFHIGDALTMLLPLWSLCIEEQFYLFLPVALCFLPAVRKRLLLFCSMLVLSIVVRGCIITHFQGAGHEAWYRNTFAHLDPIMVGCIIAILNQRFQLFARLHNFGFAITLTGLSGLAWVLVSAPDVSTNSFDWTWLLLLTSSCFGAILFGACSGPSFGSKILSAIGKKTYAMYLWHYFVLSRVSVYVAEHGFKNAYADWAAVTIGAFVVTFGVAWLSWRIVEGPCNKLKRKFQPHLNRAPIPEKSATMALLS